MADATASYGCISCLAKRRRNDADASMVLSREGDDHEEELYFCWQCLADCWAQGSFKSFNVELHRLVPEPIRCD